MTAELKHKAAQDEIEAALARIGGDETVRFRPDPKPKDAVGIFGSGGALRLANDLESLRRQRRDGRGAEGASA